jgi:hypothetical protein
MVAAAAGAAVRMAGRVQTCFEALSSISARTLLFAAIAVTLWPSCCRAGELGYFPVTPLLTWLDWGREPDDVPPRFRTNCGFHNGRFYCAYRCGSTYQFYYCSRASSGCCHIGDGYCDYRGYLRCRP